MIFTKKIKELFEKRGERASFSKMTNISHQKLSQWQKGSIAGVDKIETFCKLSGLSANWLILDVGPKELSKSNNEKENKSELNIMKGWNGF